MISSKTMANRVSKTLNWERIQQIFDEASQLPREGRQEWVANACQGDRTLYLQVESLLLALDQEGGFLENQIASYAAQVATGTIPERIGAYRVISEIGRGGMGVVYLAERADGQYQRRVAIKLVVGGPASTPELLRRFGMERQILGALQHPNIAQLLDAGIADEGTPYLVMEHVEGVRIDQYCDWNKVSLRDRIELFRHVCSAVQYAHRNLVVHRDLKPSNILVTAEGVPKLLDFGIAKLLRGSDLPNGATVVEAAAEPLTLTAPAQRLMTREYASPEQIRGLAITTATDIYALGIVLYGLLAGRHPLQVSGTDFLALERAICETEAQPPSAAAREATNQSLAGELRGDLDAIVLKAIRKEPGERYASVEHLAEDLNRYLNGFPVLATRGTRRYRAVKFVRRHRWGIAGAAAFVVVLLAFGTGMSFLAARLARERTYSKQEAADAREAQQVAQAVTHFLQDDLLAQASASHQEQAGPDAKVDPNLTVRAALDRAAAKIEGKFAKQPLVEASIRDTIGQAYINLGLFPDARRQWERALELHRNTSGDRDPKTLWEMRNLADLELSHGEWAQAGPLLTQLLEIDRSTLGPRNPETRSVMYSLGVADTRLGKYAQGETVLAEALELSHSISGERNDETVGLMRDLADEYSNEGKYAKAEPLFERTLEIQKQLFGPEYNDILITKLFLSRLYDREGKFEQAERVGADALGSARRVMGESHPTTAFLTSQLGNAYFDEGKYDRAQALFQKALDLDQRIFGSDNPLTLTAFSDVGRMNEMRGKYAEAERLFTQTLEKRRRVMGDEHPYTLRLMAILAELYDREGRYKEAEKLLVETTSVQRRVLGESHPETLGNLSGLGRAQLEQAKYSEAESTLRATAGLYSKTSADSWQRYNCENLLGRSLAGQKKFVEAEPLVTGGYRGMAQHASFVPAPQRYLLNEAGTAIPHLYYDWGKRQDAARWKEKLSAAKN
ncbi:MAG TPA: serine/threonine-protein kinase [Candidatus Bathyarchaeia archaeon]|nr:serine/threonine-protein kinase [Candidatus Bathyarchaeia archaeon]